MLRLLQYGLCACVLLVLTACSTAGGNTVAVNLANAKAQAVATYDALKAEDAAMAPTLTAAQQASVQNTLALLGTAVAAFDAVPTSAVATEPTVAQTIQNVLSNANGVIALLPLPPLTQLAIQSGLVLINGILAGAQTVTVPAVVASAPVTAPSTASLTYGQAAPLAAPIRIPTPNL